MNKIKLPNFFILGAGRSGTTTLFYCLRQHPQIYMAPVKEPSFFCEIFQVVDNPVDYVSLFNGVTDEKVVGEASHVYMTNPGSAVTIKPLFPDAKFVVILRNPADRALSLYKFMIYRGLEWLNPFEKALDAEKSRVDDPKFKKNCPQYFYNYLYFRSGLYGHQLNRYLNLYDRQQFFFLTTEQLQEQPQEAFAGIYHFLGVDKTFRPDLKVHNHIQHTIRSPRLHYLLTTKLKGIFHNLNIPYSDVFTEFSLKVNSCKEQDFSENTRKTLTARYIQDIKDTEDITGLSLSHWYE